MNLSTGIRKNDAGSLTVSKILRTSRQLHDEMTRVATYFFWCDSSKWCAIWRLNLARIKGVPSARCSQSQSDTGQSNNAVTYAAFVSNWIFDLDLIEFCSVVQLDQERITDGAPLRVVVLHAKALVFDTTNLCTKRVNSRIGGRFVGAASCST